MLSKIKTIVLNGLIGKIIEVQTDIACGMPSFDIVGLPDASMKEAKERIKIAIKNSGISFPSKKIVINLAPANIKKNGTSFDLPMSIGILFSLQVIKANELKLLSDTIFIGELSLDGKIEKINGVLPMCIEAKRLGIKKVILPVENCMEASVVEDLEIIPVYSLIEIIELLNGKVEYRSTQKNMEKNKYLVDEVNYDIDFSDVKGQKDVKRGIEIAAAGGHHCMLIGNPGTGKTMISQRIPTILPKMTFNEKLEVTKIYSIVGRLNEKCTLINVRPFRAPHYTTTTGAIIGGGKYPMPGEISLANYGVLYLDEFPEFKREVIEALRGPLEERTITITRVNGNVTYPANFMLVISCNPCPCGYYGDPLKKCTCSEKMRRRYISKLSGPLLDRIDIQIAVKNVSYENIKSKYKEECSCDIRKRVNIAREIQLERYKNINIFSNAELNSSQIEEFCYINKECYNLLKEAFEKLNLSVRAYNKIIKVSRTIADLEQSKDINYKHIIEAMQYRKLDRNYIN